jgi:hypothetical protein
MTLHCVIRIKIANLLRHFKTQHYYEKPLFSSAWADGKK